ncbi:4'-phosphopantetheinyl transferase superfamily protein [uncultured Castellaniella sp.]|uniref:4'-phosphopantetheinyl transferase family protein n=1 Tax=uncultured Castellaniella sp. TaxID=647907 RepID=UPI0026123237|nr:4'-phosphopantetheinyl transferase superfamily protein [uncultured Castellaniella sp.]
MTTPRIIALRGLPDEEQARRLRRDLPEAEWQWIARLRQPQDRLRSLLGRALARRLLAPRLDLAPARIPLTTGPHGKPLLAALSGWHFSIAHSGDQVLAAVGPQALGVDVERCPERVDEALFRFATGREPGRTDPSRDGPRDETAGTTVSDAQAFCAEWVRREAVLKACGLGLTIEPGTLRLRACGQGWHRVDGPPEVRGLHVRLLGSSPGYRAALCLPAPRDDWQLTRLGLDAWLSDPEAVA